MKEIISAIIMPLPLLFICIICGLLFLWRKKIKTGKVLFILSGLWLLIITTKPVPVLLVKNLERIYLPFFPDSSDFAESVNIYVLAAGHTDDKRLPSNGQLSATGLARITEAVRLYREISPSRIIISGPGGLEDLNQAEVLKRTCLIMGVEDKNIELIKDGVNTRTEASEYIKKYGNDNELILVTSAIHMRRALIWFREYGIEPFPAPADFMIRQGSKKGKYQWMPSANYLKMMEAATHEYAGLVLAKTQKIVGRK